MSNEKDLNMLRTRIASTLIVGVLMSGCGGDSITNITIVEAEKSAQAPLVFAQQSVSVFIDHAPEQNTLSGGSGSGNVSYTVSDDTIASVDPNTGTVTFLDDGVVFVQATKAGDDVYQATSTSYELNISKYDRPELQNLTFVEQHYRVQLFALEDNGNPFIPTIDRPKATNRVELDFNLPAGSFGLDPNNFDPDNTATFNASTSSVIYDSLGESYNQTFYFVNDGNSTVGNEWLVVTSVNGAFYDMANADGSDPANPIAYAFSGDNWVGFNSNLQGPLSTVYTNGVYGTRLTFSNDGDLVTVAASDGVILPGGGANLQFPTTTSLFGLASNGADATQTISLDFNFDGIGIREDEPTQYAAPFEVRSLHQDGYSLGWLADSQVSYESLNTDIAMVSDNGRLTLLSRGETMIFAIIAEDERFKESRVSYQLFVE